MDIMFTTAAFAGAEKIINTALDYDPATRLQLAKLAPQVLAIHISTPSCTVFIAPSEDGIRLLNQYEGEVTTQLHGSLPALLSLINSERLNLKDSGVQLIGNTAFLADLQKILLNLDIDWEEILTQLFGDIAGHQTAELIRSKFSWMKNRAANIQRLTSEFLTEELSALPSKPELAHFYREIDELALAVDRIEARILSLKPF